MIAAMEVALKIVEFLQPDHDEERCDFRDIGNIARDEDDRAVFADAAREGEREACEKRGQEGGQDHLDDSLKPRRTERGGGFFEFPVEIGEYGLHRAHHEGQADEDEGDDDAERRIGNLYPERHEPAAEPAIRCVESGEGETGHRRRQGEGQVDRRIEKPLAGKLITHKHPGGEKAEDDIHPRRNECCTERKFQRGNGSRVEGEPPELVPAEPRRLDEHA